MSESHHSLFHRLRQYRYSPLREAREDRLTEALAATLEAAPDAATAMVADWFRNHDSETQVEVGEPVAVRTQRPAGLRGRVDLELVFGKPSRPMFRLWVECKVDAPAERPQIERYLAALPTAHPKCPGRACWLLPLDRDVEGGTPSDAPVFRWTDVAAGLDDWRSALPREEQAGFAAELVREFLRHLEEQELASYKSE